MSTVLPLPHYADCGASQQAATALATLHCRPTLRCRHLPAGTDPGEGSALGIALLRTLVKGGPGGAGLTMASTHQGALTSLKYEDERFENASVEFDEVKLAPTYRFDRPCGVFDRQLAGLAGLAPAVAVLWAAVVLHLVCTSAC